MTAYYNEIDPFAAAWLRELIADGLIAPGDVDTRSITEVQPHDLAHYDQCHFFAGIGGWSYALRLAGVPDDARVWTGSCPCQPVSCAGKQRGHLDERHLWPELFRLIRECRPELVFGEQVASRLGLDWLAGVHLDLEGAGYRVGAADLPAAGVGAPHIRQRLYWVADRASGGLGTNGRAPGEARHLEQRQQDGGVVDATGAGRRGGHRDPKNRDNLEDEVKLTGWATPASRDWRDGRASRETMDGNSRPLNEQATQYAGWDTPHCPRKHDSDNSDSTYLGRQVAGMTVLTVISGESQKLNVFFSAWLQGFPKEWTFTGLRAAFRSRKRTSRGRKA